jgi:hypothetical protein
MMGESPPTPFPLAGRRKIAPFHMPENPGPNAAKKELMRFAAEKGLFAVEGGHGVIGGVRRG